MYRSACGNCHFVQVFVGPDRMKLNVCVYFYVGAS